MPASIVAGSLLIRMTGTPGAPSTTCFTTEANFAASPPSSVTAMASTLSFWPTRSISDVLDRLDLLGGGVTCLRGLDRDGEHVG